jgi:hypothetical protein
MDDAAAGQLGFFDDSDDEEPEEEKEVNSKQTMFMLAGRECDARGDRRNREMMLLLPELLGFNQRTHLFVFFLLFFCAQRLT